MSKIIIDNRSGLTDDEAVKHVSAHMRMHTNVGRYLGGSLCYNTNGHGIKIVYVENRKSDRFVVEDV